MGLRELATKKKAWWRVRWSAYAVTKINELQKYYRRTMINNTYYLKSMQDTIQASLYYCSSTNQRPDHNMSKGFIIMMLF